ncbi:MAG: RNA polymerase sigma factor [Solimonas sp.]
MQEPAAVHENLDAFLASVERRALRIAEIATQDRDDALDLVQDAMLQLARRYGCRPPTEWPPLFHRILGNRIRDWQRRQTLRRRLFFRHEAPAADAREPDLLATAVDAAQPDHVDALQSAEALRRLEQALRALPRRQREAFVLRVWEGFDVEDTARAMGCSGGSVKTHLSRALRALRDALAGVWP